MNLYECNGKIYTVNDFIDSLKPHINKGDTLALEIDTMRFGKICSGLNKTNFLEAVFKIFYELVGPEGNIIVPTFSYSWGIDSPEKHFDVLNTPSKVGLFPEYFRKRKDTIRTLDPMFSFAIWGKDKEWLSKNKNKTSFGKGSLYEKIHKLNAKLVSFGIKKHDPTFIHYIEQFFHENIESLHYRFIKKFTGTLVNRNNHKRVKYKDYQFCFSRFLDRHIDLEFDEKKIVRDLDKENKLATIEIGNGRICISGCESTFNTGLAGLKADKKYFLRKKEKKETLTNV